MGGFSVYVPNRLLNAVHDCTPVVSLLRLSFPTLDIPIAPSPLPPVRRLELEGVNGSITAAFAFKALAKLNVRSFTSTLHSVAL